MITLFLLSVIKSAPWVIGFLALAFGTAVLLGRWIALGESDVNGDPERDAAVIGGVSGETPEDAGETPAVPETLRRQCAWCGAGLSGNPMLTAGTYKLDTHGICDACMEQHFFIKRKNNYAGKN
jgi:hypothetical protein